MRLGGLTRRHFLGAGAAALGIVAVPEVRRPVPDIREPWKSLEYGSDLRWGGSNTFPSSDLGVLGNGRAVLRYKRDGGSTEYRFRLDMGSTTAPPAGIWYFELPPEVGARLLYKEDLSAYQLGGVMRAKRNPLLFVNATRHGLSRVVLNANGSGLTVLSPVWCDNATGLESAPTSTNPWTWGAGDYLEMNGLIEILDN